MASWYLPTRSIRAQKTMLSTNDSKSMLNAPRTWEPVRIDRISSTICSLVWPVIGFQSSPTSRLSIW